MVTVNPFEPEGLKWKCQGHCFIGFSGGDQIYLPQRRLGTPPLWVQEPEALPMGSLFGRPDWFIYVEIGLGPRYSGHLGVAKAPAWFIFCHFHTQLFYLPFFWHFQYNCKYGPNFPFKNLNPNGDKSPKG